MEAYKFETTVLPGGNIKIPEMYHLDNSHIEVVLFLNKEEDDFWDTLPDAEKDDIEKGLDDLKNNKKRDFYEFLKKHR